MAHRSGDSPVKSGVDALSRVLFEDLLAALPSEARIAEATVGLHWTAVTAEVNGHLQCGLASTVVGEHAHGEVDDVPGAGEVTSRSLKELAALAHSPGPTERALGMAAINASLPRDPSAWIELNAGEAIAQLGSGRRVALVGHFPFIPEVRGAVGELFVLEQDPSPGEHPAETAPDILPSCSVVAITAMTLLNGTFGRLMSEVAPEATVMLLGPSAPLSPVLFDHGIDVIAGTHVTAIGPVMEAIKEGANYRQIHRIGTQLVTLARISDASN